MEIIGLNIGSIRRPLTAVVVVAFLAGVGGGCKKDRGTSGPTAGPAASQPAGELGAPVARHGTIPDDSPAQRQARREQDLAAIARAKSAAELKGFLSGDRPILKAALERLAQIGDVESVRLLGETLESARRSPGAGGEGSAMALAMHSLADTAPGKPQALAVIDKAVDRLLKDGPAVATYSHLYDTQYYEVLQEGIRGLGGSDDPAFSQKLQRIAGDESRFYSVREAAQQALLRREMRRQKAATPAERVALLLGRVEPAGALLENTWSGKRPGDKLPAAIRQSTVETLILAEGWDAAEPVSRKLAAAGNDTERLAMGKLLSTMIVQRLGDVTPGADVAVEKKMLRTLIEEVSKAGAATMGSPTLDRIFRRIQIAADALEDEDIWAKAKALHDRIKFEDAWTGSAPLKDALGVALPPEAKFIPELSRKIATPYGTIVKASFVTTQAPEDLMKYFQDKTGQKGVFKPEPGQARAVAGGASSRAAGPTRTGTYLIPVAQTPAELSEWVNFGVTVYVSEQPYEYRPFGQVVYSGRTLFEITVKQ